MSRLLPSGSSEMRRLSNRTPTSALVVFSSGVSAVTVTVSASAAGRQRDFDDGVLVERQPDAARTDLVKAAISAVTS